MGLNAKPCVKGKDSINFGINLMKQYNLNITEDSLNLRKEFRSYKWATDKNGKETGKPIDNFNHGIDAARYLISLKMSQPTGKYVII